LINSPFSPWPSYSQEEADAVSQVLLSNKVNYWTGVEAREFEREFSRWCGVKHSIALANGTVALDLALHALQLSPGDEVVVTPRTFIASVSCVVNAGATPVFADVSAVSGNISAETIAKVLTPRTKAIVCVHLAGYPCDMDPIMALAEKHSLHVIEDCAQANGARYKGRSVGAIGHIGAWSFCQDKIMTTGGEGGMITTNDEQLWRRMWAFKDHGKSYEAVYEREHPPGYRWLHDGFGTNWRMTELQAAIGRIQLRRLADWTSARNANSEYLSQAFQPFSGQDGPLLMPVFSCSNCSQSCILGVGGGCVHARYKYYVYLRPENLRPGWNRDRILDEINERGVPCYQGSCSEVYLERAFDGTGWRPNQRLPFAKLLGETSLMFLVHPTLTFGEVEKTSQVAIEVLRRAWRTPGSEVLAP
jgi:dTDP-4-amino-4,6-dideoxygalactose transaminase